MNSRIWSFSRRDPQLLKNQLAELFGRIDVERLPGKLVDLRFQNRDSAAELFPVRGKSSGVYPEADRLHSGQHLHKRKLHVVHQLFHFIFRKFLCQRPVQSLDRRQIFTCRTAGIRFVGERRKSILRIETVGPKFNA